MRGRMASAIHHSSNLLFFFVSEDAAKMLSLLDAAQDISMAQAVCCQLAYSTSSRAFEILCAKCETKGLVFVNTASQAVGAVFYDRDPTWQHETLADSISSQVTLQLAETGGTALPALS